jgi:hypothetical protein
MGQLRRHPIRNTLAAAAGALILTMTGQAAAAGSSQNSRDDYYNQNQLLDTDCLVKNQRGWVRCITRDGPENYRETSGRIGDYDRMQAWPYGAGGFDRNSAGPTTDEPTDASPKARVSATNPDAFVRNVHRSSTRI